MAVEAFPILAMDARVLTALAVGGGLAVFVLLLLVTSASELRGKRKARVPVGFRPAPSDEELERRVQISVRAWGALLVMLMAVWLPVYWLREPTRLATKKQQFVDLEINAHSSGNTGGKQLYKDLCAQCHGESAEGGKMTYIIDDESYDYAEPPLKYIYDRYRKAGRSDDEITQLVRDAIERGRPGTPMPTWGIAHGGPLISHQMDTLVVFLQSIQEPIPPADSTDGEALFAANCAVCHGENGRGALGPNLTVALERLTEKQLKQTIEDGRLNMHRPSMPSWEYLGEDAVNALVAFIESIQRSN